MVSESHLVEIIIQIIQKMIDTDIIKEKIPVDQSTVIQGMGSVIDSLALINIIGELEQIIEQKTGAGFTVNLSEYYDLNEGTRAEMQVSDLAGYLAAVLQQSSAETEIHTSPVVQAANTEQAFGVGILGLGKYIPEKLVTNDEISAMSGVQLETIAKKSGVESRYIAADDENASDMSAAAARQAIEQAGISPDEIDLVVAATFTSDYVYPAMACRVQELINAQRAGAFDLNANCVGFQVGVSVVADRLKCDHSMAFGLVLGTALQSRFIRWDDPELAFFFGDGVGAAVMGRVPAGYGILSSEIFTNGKAYDAIRLRGGGSSFPIRPENVGEGLQYYDFNWADSWDQIIRYEPEMIRRAIEKSGLTLDDIDFFIFHQTNLRLIEYMMAKMKQPMSKTYTTAARYGNTADASLPITLCEAVEQGLIKRGDRVVLSGVGAGFVFGASVIRWY